MTEKEWRKYDKIINRRVEISWNSPNGVALNTLTPDLIRKMKSAGCRGLAFGIEHGDLDVRRKVVRKPIESDHVKRIVNACKQLSIQTTGLSVIELPGETKRSIIEQLNLK
ncbi:MAG: hypothetical protein QXI71_05610 [Candidatus Bathyarchaeia archaeon]